MSTDYENKYEAEVLLDVISGRGKDDSVMDGETVESTPEHMKLNENTEVSEAKSGSEKKESNDSDTGPENTEENEVQTASVNREEREAETGSESKEEREAETGSEST